MRRDELAALAEQRRIARGGDNRRRQWASDYELLGIRGEEAVALALGCPLNLDLSTPGGDGGIDTSARFVLDTGDACDIPIQVKCSRKPRNLIVEAGRAIAGVIYILCRYDDTLDEAICLGWEWGEKLARAPVGDVMKRGVPYHYIPADQLRPMRELKARRAK